MKFVFAPNFIQLTLFQKCVRDNWLTRAPEAIQNCNTFVAKTCAIDFPSVLLF